MMPIKLGLTVIETTPQLRSAQVVHIYVFHRSLVGSSIETGHNAGTGSSCGSEKQIEKEGKKISILIF
jgi:hypothetical protein